MRHPDVPESLEGWWILHRMFHVARRAWQTQPSKQRDAALGQAVILLNEVAASQDADIGLAQLLGHKGDLMLTHYAKGLDELALIQARVDCLDLREFLTPSESYVSVLELGLYEATAKIHNELGRRALKPHSQEWNDAFDALLDEQAKNPRNAGRLWARLPRRRYICFYPMDKKRGETINWYMLPYEERARLMLDHGKIGRSFHGLVTQVISGSVGYDDWEWGVDLYADDPLVFKKLIYEMRFDEASAKYASFGQFYTGFQFSPPQLPGFLSGDRIPQLTTV
ncbi:MAG: heme-dependent peroxidase [Candidatus Eremiobacteraeota bacterium]|nr:heme-dependent peroxidase [Candidatus Eremiobacteraeota bacterium]